MLSAPRLSEADSPCTSSIAAGPAHPGHEIMLMTVITGCKQQLPPPVGCNTLLMLKPRKSRHTQTPCQLLHTGHDRGRYPTASDPARQLHGTAPRHLIHSGAPFCSHLSQQDLSSIGSFPDVACNLHCGSCIHPVACQVVLPGCHGAFTCPVDPHSYSRASHQQLPISPWKDTIQQKLMFGSYNKTRRSCVAAKAASHSGHHHNMPACPDLSDTVLLQQMNVAFAPDHQSSRSTASCRREHGAVICWLGLRRLWEDMLCCYC
jgi:hypothetical protein